MVTFCMSIRISPKTVFTNLMFFNIFLLIANVIGIIFKFCFDYSTVYGFVPLFDFDTEKNIPTLYSSFALIGCSILLLIIAVTHKRRGSSYLSWFNLAVIFLILSIDETVCIHERLLDPIRETFNTSGLFYYPWVIPYGVAVLVFSALYFRFLINLQKEVMILFIVSGVTYVSGAIGFEMISGLQADLHGTNNLTYSFITTAEELLEILGITIFIYALLIYITTQFNDFAITIKSNE